MPPTSPLAHHRSSSSSSTLPLHLHDRRLLNQIRLGRGQLLKSIRQYLDDNPQLEANYRATRSVEAANDKQKRKMMWVRDSKSQTKRVEGPFRDLCAYTSTLSASSTVPNPQLVERAKEKSTTTDQIGKGTRVHVSMRDSLHGASQYDVVVPPNMLPLPGLVQELTAELRNHHRVPHQTRLSAGSSIATAAAQASCSQSQVELPPIQIPPQRNVQFDTS